DVETGDMTEIDRDPWGNQNSVSWSGDSRWITWARAEEQTLNSSIWLYDTETGETHKMTSGFFSDASPVFSRDGEHLFYTSNRRFSNPMYEDVGSTFVYANTGVLIAVPLTEEVENPWLIESDEETWEEIEEDATDEADESDDADAESEDGEDADAEGEEVEEGDNGDNIYEGLDTDHPLFGEWEGSASGFAALGMPDDEMSLSMVIVVDDEGNISGISESSGEESDLGDVVTWDEATNEFSSERSTSGITVVSRATVDGDTMTGTWSIDAMGVSGTWEATRTTREIDEETLSEIVDSSDAYGDEPVEITVEGFEERGMEIPVDVGRFTNLAVNDKNQLMYVRFGMPGTPPAIKLVDIADDEPEEKTVLGGAGGFDISGDGKKMIAGGAQGFAIVDAKPGQNFSKRLPRSGMRKIIDPREEWEQIFTDAWRRHRDFFYVENLHGVDWDAVYDRYSAMLDDAATREDVSFIIGEMISELNVGHAYYWGGDVEGQPSENVGLLGADFELSSETDQDGTEHTAYRFARIYEGGPWDSDARGPLSQPGVDVEKGTYLLKVNGIPVDTDTDPWAAFVGLVGKDTTLTIADALVGDDEARNEREITIKPMGSEANLRYRAWVEDNRRYVDEASDGRVGYIHVPNTGVQGQNELFRQFYGQTGKDALIIDERWNGGGQIPNRFIELLNRPRTNYWARRDGRDWPWPYDSHQGPKAMLINGMAGSGGDMFPWLFRHHEIGKLVGSRTWGGLVGISGVPGLIDGGYTAVPTFGFYELDGTWGIEGHGVDPDIAVVDDPSARAEGRDPQLDAAIELMLKEADANPYRPAARPTDPDRSGMGIPDADK
ncbi:MAG: S41 family peptidase, partial [Planctomycetota bacterium]